MEEKNIEIGCDLLAWIKDNADRSKECQIVLAIEKGTVVRATCYMTDSFKPEKQ